MTEPILQVGNVSFGYDAAPILHGVSFEARRGELFIIIGPNGSGKTTLINVLTGVLAPTAGEVRIGGHRLTGLSPHHIARHGLGRTFQTARLFASLSVRENVELGVMVGHRGSVDRQVEHLLERFGLTPWHAVRAGNLPYGLQRRLEIARAMGPRPRFVLLDEPAAGLNQEESEDLLHVIRGLRDDPALRCGVLIVEHDLSLIMRLCQRIHVLNEGRTIAEGPPEQVRTDQDVITAYLGTHTEKRRKWMAAWDSAASPA